MPHTNNANAAKRKANRADPRKPRFLQKKQKPAKPPAPVLDENGVPIPVADLPLPEVLSAAEAIPRSAHTAIITEYHALEKLLAVSTDPLEKRLLLARQKEIGGLQKYQEASLHGGRKERGGESGKWCVKAMKELKVGVETGKGKEKEVEQPVEVGEDGVKVFTKVAREKLRLLDVGAISGTSFADWSWIDTTCIDLNPQAPHVLKYDFFDYPVPPPDKLFDVVGLSLVVNFIGSLSARGDILLHAHSYLKPSGYLYLVLPLPCLTNSRYMTHERLEGILTTTGWSKAKQHDSAKLTYWLLKRTEGEGNRDGKIWKKEEVRKGVRRNNFCITVGVKAGPDGEEVEEEGVGNDEEPEEDDMKMEDAPAEDEEEEWGGC
ncbi:25S rRNA (adenine2142-N1)-methyltransferase, partial [Phenoliferia sp. Uapishka_3]